MPAGDAKTIGQRLDAVIVEAIEPRVPRFSRAIVHAAVQVHQAASLPDPRQKIGQKRTSSERRRALQRRLYHAAIALTCDDPKLGVSSRRP